MAPSDDAARLEWLRGRYLAAILTLQPRTVLDVGCGDGTVLRALVRSGVAAQGVEPGRAAGRQARERGLTVCTAPAAALPFADGRFDVVAMRHVPHHLRDPAAGLREACRVARRAVVVVEPWYDRDCPHQRVGDDFEEWSKRFDRRAGMVHHPRLEAAALAEMLAPWCQQPAVHHWRHASPLPVEELAREGAAVLAATTRVTAGERHEFAGLLERARRQGWSRNGSVAVVAALR
jgi:SAM-dependent methyltransferase